MFIVGIYETDRQYGGPEEGGWWYNSGELRKVVKIFRGHEERKAYEYSYRFKHLLRLLLRLSKRHNRYSMAYRGGDFEAQVYKDAAPDYFPTIRPHYE